MKRNSEQILTEWLVINSQLAEKDALQQLFVMWYPKLQRYAYRQIGDEQKAQDAVQNTFESASRTICRLKDPGAFPKWIYQIMQNKCFDMIRQKQRQEKISAEYADFQHTLNVNEDTSETKLDTLDFEEMLVGLETELYQLVHLHYLEGFTTGEISEILSIPVGTIKSRLHQARKLIRHNFLADR